MVRRSSDHNGHDTSWTTALRPSNPDHGTTGYNETLGTLETWDGIANEWVQPSRFNDRETDAVALGTNLATAYALTKAVTWVTATGSGQGVKMSTLLQQTVINEDPTNAINVYPATAAKSHPGLSAGEPIVLQPGDGITLFYK